MGWDIDNDILFQMAIEHPLAISCRALDLKYCDSDQPPGKTRPKGYLPLNQHTVYSRLILLSPHIPIDKAVITPETTFFIYDTEIGGDAATLPNTPLGT